MNRLVEIWQQLALREQRLLVALAAGLLFALSYQLAWLPLSQAVAVERQRHTALERSLLRISDIVQRLPLLSIKQQSANHDQAQLQPLLGLIDAFLAQSELNAEAVQIRALTPNIVELELTKVAFDSLIRWLARLQQEHAVSVAEIMLQRDQKLGMVRAKINLTRE